MDPFDAVVLSELLCTPSARRILQVRRSSFGDGDQRVLVSLDELAGRVAGSPAELEGEVARARRSARRLLRLAARSGIDALAFGASGYPDALASIPDSPPVLWCQGDTRSFDRPAVAIVGSRAGSSYGCEVAARLGSELSGRGVTVVSGLARGVDAAAHRGALEGGGLTIAVLGSGVDVVYPPEHGLLVRAIASQGVVASEFAPGVPPRAFNFPRRNRIISGLSLAVVVVEASERSGSLITARCAADQGREVMVVPGNVLSGRSRGGHALIKDGAKVVETVDDILEEIAPMTGTWVAGTQRLSEETDLLLRHMDMGESYDLDQLADLSGLGGAELSSRVLELELQGRVERSAGGQLRRSRR